MEEISPTSLAVVLNSNKELEYFRDRKLSEKQASDLNKVDSKLDHGFEIGGQFIKHPSQQDKATYVANMLVSAIINNDEANMALCCSYLATRFESLKQVRATIHNDRCTIQLINDQEFVEEKAVQFINKKDLS